MNKKPFIKGKFCFVSLWEKIGIKFTLESNVTVFYGQKWAYTYGANLSNNKTSASTLVKKL